MLSRFYKHHHNKMYLEQLETPRLLIRPLTLADKAPLMEFFNDPSATEFLFIETSTDQYADQWLRRQLGRYGTGQGGMCAVVLKETNELIGQCGLLYQWVDFVPKWEVGYHFIRRFWHNGYATEAAMACRDFCLEEEMAETVISLIHPDNVRSKAVALRNGMTLWKETSHKGHPAEVFRIRREDWEKLPR
ncbi:MAG: GNAT family N-acetyltransferase [Lewinellaceae bacterium]|nr:GNAT family N-acetyltransferase [Saprospiraceae bacterium]MCB9339594.1 GNAT family N-acetyltransferase [Lewinellaceae bacterium]